MTLYRSRPLLVVGIVFTIVVAPAVAYFAPALEPGPSCDRSQEWVTAHVNTLPDTAAELVAFPASFRRSIFSALSPQTKAAIWREQLTIFANSRALSVEQRAFIDRLLAETVTSLYSKAAYEARRRTPAGPVEFERQVNRLFTSKDSRVFYELGHSIVPKPSFASIRLNATESLRRYAVGSAKLAPMCDCQADNECGTSEFRCTAQDCWYQEACGPLGTWTCIGKCNWIE